MELKVIGVSEEKEKQFVKAGITSVEELCRYLPKKYYDFRTVKMPSEVTDKETAVLSGIVMDSNTVRKGIKVRVTFRLRSADGNTFWINYFNSDYMAYKLNIGQTAAFFGKVSVKPWNGKTMVSMINPDKYSVNPADMQRILPVYKKIKGMSFDYLEAKIRASLAAVKLRDYMRPDDLQNLGLCSFDTAIRYLHNPQTPEALQAGYARVIFDKLFQFDFSLKAHEEVKNPNALLTFRKHALLDKYTASLPFALTADQQKTVQTIFDTGASGRRLHALVVGDVGYGKTEAAKCAAIMTAENGGQCAVIAPTAVLASQHIHDFTESLSPLGIKVVPLTGSLTARERNKALKEIASGQAQVIVGTHACFSDNVVYKNLCTVVVDEEHRFGVRHREKLAAQAQNGIHMISMSATPIPRSLATAIYGPDVQLMTIKTAPAFKKPIITKAITSDDEAKTDILHELQAGHQVYVVCPQIEEKEDAENVNDTAAYYRQTFEPLGYTVGVATGKMRTKDMQAAVDSFTAGKTQILIATTIIEVGVSVKNATVMVIKGGDRFGLAQMHQLRGRVGRGTAQGYCFIQYGGSSEKAKRRIDMMCSTTDGFRIAEADAKERGVGDLMGTDQTGINRIFETILKYPDYNNAIRSFVEALHTDKKAWKYYCSAFGIAE